jgi:hypothetical protein
MFQVVQQEALTGLLVEKGIFTKEEFLEMVRVVNINLTLVLGKKKSNTFKGGGKYED